MQIFELIFDQVLSLKFFWNAKMQKIAIQKREQVVHKTNFTESKVTVYAMGLTAGGFSVLSLCMHVSTNVP